MQVVIVGGGTAGWISAAALAKLVGTPVDITLIESDAIGTVGVGEATIPQIRRLNGMLGIDEAEFVRATQGSFKLGIEFNDWGHIGESYLHTFGDAGINLANLHFHHYWLRHQRTHPDSSLWDYSLHHRAAYAGKFAPLDRVGNTAMTGLAYAYHFDAGRYARYLRTLAEGVGVTRIEGKVETVQLSSETGDIQSVRLADQTQIDGDLFIDCSGFRGLLIGGALEVAYEDWSHWLPCNRAIAVGCERTDPLLPFTRATAKTAGWQWRIPLQHRTGNGHVYCDAYISDDEALATLLAGLDATPISDPKQLRFQTGRRREFWARNCVSLGLASGFLEPLESTSIHLIQSNVSRLIELFPSRLGISSALRAEYNRRVGEEYDLIRDFLILHYTRTDRDDSDFWNYCRNMEIPDSLRGKLDLFADGGHLHHTPDDLFRESSWVQVMLGQGLTPKSYHVRADRLSDPQLAQFMQDLDKVLDKAIAPLPQHQDFIAQSCAAAAQ